MARKAIVSTPASKVTKINQLTHDNQPLLPAGKQALADHAEKKVGKA